MPETYIENTSPEQHRRQDRRDIPGWGADLDPAQRPAYPKERTPPRIPAPAWTTPEAQTAQVRVHHSTERPGLTPVFGTSVPPRGLSGRLRDVAYRLSENDLRHWLLLLLADRVDMGEGIVEDLRRGRVPNLFAEMGLAAEWRHNRAGFLRKAAMIAAVAGVTLWLLRRDRSDA